MRALATVRTAPVRLSARLHTLDSRGDAGMTTAEYAVGTVAACGFGGVLFKVITSSTVLELLKAVLAKAFKISF